MKATCVGVLLAGGQSRRMGGGDKSLMPLGGRTLLAHAIAALGPQVSGLVINANGDPARFAGFGLPVVADGSADFAGPLAGVLAGMEWAASHHPGAQWIATAACDTPFFPADLVARLADAATSTRAAIAMAASEGREHFVFALWSLALAGDLAAYLDGGGRKVQSWIERHAHTAVAFPPRALNGRHVDPFFNINTAQDLAMAEAWLRKDAS